MEKKINEIVNNLSNIIIEKYKEFNKNTCKNEKFIISISGAPGSGKSTISSLLVKELNNRLTSNDLKEDEDNQIAKIVTMDGFHLDNNILTKKNLLKKKGSPPTFDIDGFLNILERLKNQKDDNNSIIYIPTFDRDLDKSIAGSSYINNKNKLLIVEGNYLLLNQEKWCNLNQYFNYSIFIKTNLKDLEERLINRWIQYKDPQPEKRALENDIPNAKLVLENSNIKNNDNILIIENNNN